MNDSGIAPPDLSKGGDRFCPHGLAFGCPICAAQYEFKAGHYTKMLELVESVKPIIEATVPDTPAQSLWKSEWLKKARAELAEHEEIMK